MGKIVKKNVSLLALLVLPWCAQAAQQKVTEDVAQTVALNFMKTRTRATKTVNDVVVEQKDGAATMYVCNFKEGGWVMVSANYSVSPVLAYSYYNAYSESDGTSGLITFYKDGIASLEAIEEGTVSEKWSKLTNGESSTLRSLSNPAGGDMLVDKDGEKVQWNQNMNLYCPKSEFDGEGVECEHALAGSVPVAVSQLMWKWKWPQYSYVIDKSGKTYEDYYDWSLLKSTVSSDEEMDEVSRLINRCGLALKCDYGCKATTWKSKDAIMYLALQDFGYNSFEAQNESLWRAAESQQYWSNLLMSELRAGRPVLCVLDNSKPSVNNMVVLSGYQYADTDGQNFYYVNAGEAVGSVNGFYKLDFSKDILDCGKAANNADVIGQYKQQRLYVGISPYTTNFCENEPVLAAGESFEKNSVTSIALPCSSSFTAQANSNVSLSSRNEIVFRSGFTAEKGASVNAVVIDETMPENSDVDIYVRLNNVKRGVNPSFTIDVKNANSWILKLGCKNNGIGFYNAGVIEADGEVVISSGWEEEWNGDRDFELYLLNNNGIIKKVSGTLDDAAYTICNYQSALGQYASVESEIEAESNGIANEETHYLPFIYPNPAIDEFTVVLNNKLSVVTVYDMRGNEILTRTGEKDMRVNLSAYGKGMYVVKVVSDSETKYDKLLLK